MVNQAIHLNYQGARVGAASFDPERGFGAFEYYRDFIDGGIELSPIKLPLSSQIYAFPELANESFRGLPGLLADALPDDFGNAVLNAWVAAQGRSPSEISPLERLQYIGKRGMGALEFSPATRLRGLNVSQRVELQSLVSIAQEILDSRKGFTVMLDRRGTEDSEAMMALLSVGTSAGGARAKAVLAFNDDFTRVRSGQVDAPPGYTHCLLKFDGVSEHNTEREAFGDPQGYGAMEYTYYQMARRCGIDMMPCRLLNEGNRRHFVTRRFDRDGNRKVHVQSLSGLVHVDYKKPGSFSYAELFGTARALRVSARDAEELLRRLVFNIVARNHDDHSKNFAFMLEEGRWRLTPAYDLAYSYKPGSKWVSQHWTSLNGKRSDFKRQDVHSLEKQIPRFTRKHIDRVIDETVEQVAHWSVLARENEVPEALVRVIESNLRLGL